MPLLVKVCVLMMSPLLRSRMPKPIPRPSPPLRNCTHKLPSSLPECCTCCAVLSSSGISVSPPRLTQHEVACPLAIVLRLLISAAAKAQLLCFTSNISVKMDRHSQLSFSRPGDRMINNPNHQNAAQQPPPSFSSTASYQPPPVHVPFSDPFRRNDPFLPGAHTQRRDTYGYQSNEGHAGPAGDRHGPTASWGPGAGTDDCLSTRQKHRKTSHCWSSKWHNIHR